MHDIVRHFEVWQEALNERDECWGQRAQLLDAAKRVLRSEVVVGADDLAEWQRCMRELQRAVARCEGKT